MSTAFHLPKGTRISHGTALANLHSILKLGLQPSHSRHQLRDFTEERPKAAAVYVGGPSAFFGAWAASGALVKEYSMHELRMPMLGPVAAANPRELRRMEFAPPPLAIPVVLTIELQEDTRLVGDEDFALWQIGADQKPIRRAEDTDESIWDRFKSGGLVREGGIPSSWIKSMQFPQLLHVDDVDDRKMHQLTKDCWCLAAGIAQNHGLMQVSRVQLPEGPWTDASTLSQSRTFDEKSVNGLLAMRHVNDEANLLYNLLVQYDFVSGIGEQEFQINFMS